MNSNLNTLPAKQWSLWESQGPALWNNIVHHLRPENWSLYQDHVQSKRYKHLRGELTSFLGFLPFLESSDAKMLKKKQREVTPIGDAKETSREYGDLLIVRSLAPLKLAELENWSRQSSHLSLWSSAPRHMRKGLMHWLRRGKKAIERTPNIFLVVDKRGWDGGGLFARRARKRRVGRRGEIYKCNFAYRCPLCVSRHYVNKEREMRASSVWRIRTLSRGQRSCKLATSMVQLLNPAQHNS